MKCKKCREDYSWHDWEQKPYCSPYCRGDFKDTSIGGEWTRHAKTEIAGYEADIEQPKRYDGTFNPRFVAAHGTKVIEKNFNVDKKTILANIEKYG